MMLKTVKYLGKDTALPEARLVLVEDHGDSIELLLSERCHDQLPAVVRHPGWQQLHPGPNDAGICRLGWEEGSFI